MKILNQFLLFFILVFSLETFTLVRAQVPANQFTNNNYSITLPLRDGSVRFLAIGDTGSGAKGQTELAQVMYGYRKLFPYEFVLLMGDNIYSSEKPEDMKRKFEDVYKPILDEKIPFYASLGNHDESTQRYYELFNMKGEEYYRITKGDVAIYALNSNYMDKRQVDWLTDKLSKDDKKWKIAFFHHPPYSSGKHGSSEELRKVVEPLFIKYKVNVVLAGHEHFYERLKPQNGIYYFITGAGGKLRKGDIDKRSSIHEKGFDTDLSFMLIEIWKDEMHFQVISRTGATVDSGVLRRSN
jgi:hypothetical protein